MKGSSGSWYNRIFILIVTLMLCISLASCAALQRKFTRKKKQEKEKATPVITTYDYSKDQRYEELYKKHFLFWKTWQGELIERLDGTYRKRVSCYNYAIDNLEEMRKILMSPKKEELDRFVTRIKSLDSDIKKKRLTKSKKNRLRRVLESTKRQIENRFSYSDVKDFIELHK